jgi:hypothetical protein
MVEVARAGCADAVGAAGVGARVAARRDGPRAARVVRAGAVRAARRSGSCTVIGGSVLAAPRAGVCAWTVPMEIAHAAVVPAHKA